MLWSLRLHDLAPVVYRVKQKLIVKSENFCTMANRVELIELDIEAQLNPMTSSKLYFPYCQFSAILTKVKLAFFSSERAIKDTERRSICGPIPLATDLCDKVEFYSIFEGRRELDAFV